MTETRTTVAAGFPQTLRVERFDEGLMGRTCVLSTGPYEVEVGVRDGPKPFTYIFVRRGSTLVESGYFSFDSEVPSLPPNWGDAGITLSTRTGEPLWAEVLPRAARSIVAFLGA